MSKPFLSVVTPSYNQREYVERTIESIRSQNFEDYEHIVVDGGSTDGSLDVLREYEDEYPLRWISEPDDGIGNAVNKGIELANGEWIGWQNTDDFYLPGAFQAFEDVVRANPNTDIVYGDIVLVDGNENELNKLFYTEPFFGTGFIQRRQGILPASNQGAIIRADALHEIGGVSEELEYIVDVHLFANLLERENEWVHLPKFVAAHRNHETDEEMERLFRERWREYHEVHEYPEFEKRVPEKVLRFAAKALKATKLLQEGRVKAFEYKLKEQF
ncbi:glycosyltransferase family 2 protein [Halorussus marinus]|uniref:glycosyltransferase family 2 protein n=1 Tax=Halorussus marinus TaxID=2505976 RepID=UPI00106DD616|nr:glycosyltransferase family 2 protein [Halorussus marinus]